MRIIYTSHIVEHCVTVWSNSDENCRRSILKKIMTSPLWRHPIMWHHPEHAQSIAHRKVYIGCPLDPSRYMASFPRYLAPKLRTDRMNDGRTDRHQQWVNNKGCLSRARKPIKTAKSVWWVQKQSVVEWIFRTSKFWILNESVNEKDEVEVNWSSGQLVTDLENEAHIKVMIASVSSINMCCFIVFRLTIKQSRLQYN